MRMPKELSATVQGSLMDSAFNESGETLLVTNCSVHTISPPAKGDPSLLNVPLDYSSDISYTCKKFQVPEFVRGWWLEENQVLLRSYDDRWILFERAEVFWTASTKEFCPGFESFYDRRENLSPETIIDLTFLGPVECTRAPGSLSLVQWESCPKPAQVVSLSLHHVPQKYRGKLLIRDRGPLNPRTRRPALFKKEPASPPPSSPPSSPSSPAVAEPVIKQVERPEGRTVTYIADEATQDLPDSDVINCRCGAVEEDSSEDEEWVECEGCHAWSHVNCVNFFPGPQRTFTCHGCTEKERQERKLQRRIERERQRNKGPVYSRNGKRIGRPPKKKPGDTEEVQVLGNAEEVQVTKEVQGVTEEVQEVTEEVQVVTEKAQIEQESALGKSPPKSTSTATAALTSPPAPTSAPSAPTSAPSRAKFVIPKLSNGKHRVVGSSDFASSVQLPLMVGGGSSGAPPTSTDPSSQQQSQNTELEKEHCPDQNLEHSPNVSRSPNQGSSAVEDEGGPSFALLVLSTHLLILRTSNHPSSPEYQVASCYEWGAHTVSDYSHCQPTSDRVHLALASGDTVLLWVLVVLGKKEGESNPDPRAHLSSPTLHLSSSVRLTLPGHVNKVLARPRDVITIRQGTVSAHSWEGGPPLWEVEHGLPLVVSYLLTAPDTLLLVNSLGERRRVELRSGGDVKRVGDGGGGGMVVGCGQTDKCTVTLTVTAKRVQYRTGVTATYQFTEPVSTAVDHSTHSRTAGESSAAVDQTAESRVAVGNSSPAATQCCPVCDVTLQQCDVTLQQAPSSGDDKASTHHVTCAQGHVIQVAANGTLLDPFASEL